MREISSYTTSVTPVITLCAWGNGIPWAPSPAAPLEPIGRPVGPRLTPYRPATSAVVSTGPKPGDHTIRTEPRDRFEHAQRRPGPKPRRHLLYHEQPVGVSDRSTKAGAETPATLLIGAEHLHGRNSVPDLGTTDCDVDHLFGPYLAVDVVMDPQMPRNLRQVTPWSHAALESPRVRKFPVQSTQGSPSS